MMSLLCITVISLTLAGSAFSQEMTPSPLQVRVFAELGANVTLPCRKMSYSFGGIRVKWTKIAEDESLNEDVLSSMGFHKKTFGSFQDRVYLQQHDSKDASLIITGISKKDIGKYRCEIINGMEDTVQEVHLDVLSSISSSNPARTGVVFPYWPDMGRYKMNFMQAKQACQDQDAVIASYDQLFDAWKDGLDWCNAGWLKDGTVQYPITKSRAPCGGSNATPGLRSYGMQNLMNSFDVFCYSPRLQGDFYWLVQPERLTFDEAVQACLKDNAEIAKVTHMYAAWKMENYDRCDAGWLADGSVRYPISRPRKNCSPDEAAVRFVGFPDKEQQLYGVYCYKAY